MGRGHRFHTGISMAQALLLCGALVLPAQADTDIEFTGTLVADPCQVAMDDEEQQVEFGNIARRAFLNHDSTAPKTFTVRLVECDPSVATTVSVTFLGDGNNEAMPGTFATTGEAKGIAIRLRDSEGHTVVPNKPLAATNVQEGETVLAWQAEVTATAMHEVTEGEFFSTVTFSLAYE